MKRKPKEQSRQPLTMREFEQEVGSLLRASKAQKQQEKFKKPARK